jgi:hypothetical protein
MDIGIFGKHDPARGDRHDCRGCNRILNDPRVNSGEEYEDGFHAHTDDRHSCNGLHQHGLLVDCGTAHEADSAAERLPRWNPEEI